MPELLERVADKLDKVEDSLKRIDTTLAAQHESLKDHMRRTELLEQQMTPVTEHVRSVTLIIRIILWIVATATAVTGLWFSHK